MSNQLTTVFSKTIEEIKDFWEFLPDKPEETPEGIARTLWLVAAGNSLSLHQALEQPLTELNDKQTALLKELVSKKKSGIPLAHLSGRTSFLGLEFLTGPEALIPRVETQIVGKCALAKLKELSAERGPLKVIDVCTGCGNLALSYAHHTPDTIVYAADLSESAVALAEKNCAQLGLKGRASFYTGDLFAPFHNSTFYGSCDLVSCNPPYISTAKVTRLHKEISQFEPEMAFNGGAFGVTILYRLIKEAPLFLKPGSWLCFEVGLGQGPVLVKQLKQNEKFELVETFMDESDQIRAIAAKVK